MVAAYGTAAPHGRHTDHAFPADRGNLDHAAVCELGHHRAKPTAGKIDVVDRLAWICEETVSGERNDVEGRRDPCVFVSGQRRQQAIGPVADAGGGRSVVDIVSCLNMGSSLVVRCWCALSLPQTGAVFSASEVMSPISAGAHIAARCRRRHCPPPTSLNRVPVERRCLYGAQHADRPLRPLRRRPRETARARTDLNQESAATRLVCAWRRVQETELTSWISLTRRRR